MREREDDTTEPSEPSGSERGPSSEEREPGSYYYDDSTGYEIYDPEKEDEGEEEDELCG